MLEGAADVSLGDDHLTLRSGMALSVQLDDRHGLNAVQPAGQHIRALTLGLDESRLTTMAGEPMPCQTSRMRAWRLPGTLRSALEEAITTPLEGAARRLQFEGLSLQLLAHGLPEARRGAVTLPTPGEQQRLERVREALRADPAREHRLDALAELAAMSPASLRRKYSAAFGKSVFEDLREYRLAWPGTTWRAASACSRPPTSAAIATPATLPPPFGAITASRRVPSPTLLERCA